MKSRYAVLAVMAVALLSTAAQAQDHQATATVTTTTANVETRTVTTAPQNTLRTAAQADAINNGYVPPVSSTGRNNTAYTSTTTAVPAAHIAPAMSNNGQYFNDDAPNNRPYQLIELSVEAEGTTPGDNLNN